MQKCTPKNDEPSLFSAILFLLSPVWHPRSKKLLGVSGRRGHSTLELGPLGQSRFEAPRAFKIGAGTPRAHLSYAQAMRKLCPSAAEIFKNPAGEKKISQSNCAMRFPSELHNMDGTKPPQ